MDISEKIKKIERLIEGAGTEGERQAAKFARKRLLDKYKTKEATIEYRISLGNVWKKRLFVAICNKYGLQTYRYKRQKYSTAMVQIKKSFLDEVIWPEFKKFATLLEELVDEIMFDLIGKIHHGDQEEQIVSGDLITHS